MLRITRDAEVWRFGWSADSQMIAYVADHTVADERGELLTAVPMLWAAAVAGPDRGRRVLLSPYLGYSPGGIKWSPDGRFVAFQVNDDAWVVQLSYRPMTAEERLSVGLSALEEEKRE